MRDFIDIVIIGVIIIIVPFFVLMFSYSGSKTATKDYIECERQAIQAIPDPNEVETRVEFLKDCYE